MKQERVLIQPDNTALQIWCYKRHGFVLTDIERTWTRSEVQSSVWKRKVRGSEECRDSRVHPRHVWRVCGDSRSGGSIEMRCENQAGSEVILKVDLLRL